MRWVRTRVLPEPAPATTSRAPSPLATASAWSGLSPASRSRPEVAAPLDIVSLTLPLGCDELGDPAAVRAPPAILLET